MPVTQHLFFSSGESVFRSWMAFDTGWTRTLCVRVSAPWVGPVCPVGMRRGGSDCCASDGEERKEGCKLPSISIKRVTPADQRR